MAIQAQLVRWLPKLSIVLCPVTVVAGKTGDSASIHHALDEVVSLHAILVSRAVRKVRKCRLTQLVLFELPKVLQMESDVKAYRSIVIFAFDLAGQRTPLGMALNAGIVRAHVVHPLRIENITP